MENSNEYFGVSVETVAAWLDGNLSSEEDAEFSRILLENQELAEILDSCDDIDTTYEEILDGGYDLPAELTFDFELPEVPDSVFEDDFMPQNIDNCDNEPADRINTTGYSGTSHDEQAFDESSTTDEESCTDLESHLEEDTLSDGLDMF